MHSPHLSKRIFHFSLHQIVLLLENRFRLETKHEKLRRRGFNKSPNREGDSYVDEMNQDRHYPHVL